MKPEFLKSTLAFSILKYTQRYPKNYKNYKVVQRYPIYPKTYKDIQSNPGKPRVPKIL